MEQSNVLLKSQMRPKKHLEAEYKSGLEARFQKESKELGFDLPYESKKIKYIIPEKQHSYTPDFEVTSNVFIETKGLWTSQERKKACLIKAQHPHITILYVLYRDQRLSKKSSTTYISWAQKQGLLICTFKDKDTWVEFIRTHLEKANGKI